MSAKMLELVYTTVIMIKMQGSGVNVSNSCLVAFCNHVKIYFLIFQSLFVKMVLSDFVVDKPLLRVELRFALITVGAQFVMTYGQTVMVTLSAKSSDSLQLVCDN